MSRHSAHRPARKPGRGKLVWSAAGLALLCGGSVVDISVAPRQASAAVSANLVADPDFVHGTGAWTTNPGGSLSLTTGYGGHPAIVMTNRSARPLTLALNDKKNTVAKTTVGAVYQASAWVKTTAPGISAADRMMEYQGSTNHGTALGSSWLRTSNWAHVSVNYRAATSTSSIDFNVLAWSLPAHHSLLISQPSVTVLSDPAGAVTSSATPSSSAPRPSAAPSSSAPSSTAPPISSNPPSTVVSASESLPQNSLTAPGHPTVTNTPTGVPIVSISPSPGGGSPAGMHLVWSDEFNSIDTSKWNVRNNTWANNEQSIDTSRPANVFVSNGTLTLRAIKEAYKVGSTTRDYTSGYLDTIGKESWQYGRIEMRAKLPAAQGLWPAFWLRNNSGLGELDIMEAIGGMNNKSVQTIHQSTNGDMARAGHEDVLPNGTNSDWHVYAVDREPGSVKWYVDDRLVFSQTTSTLPWLDSTFNSPMNIRLNLQVGGSMPSYYKQPVGATPAGASEYQIDYVRVYQH